MKIVLIGASVRPLIASCIAAGITPVAIDLFADWDSKQMIDHCRMAGAQLIKIKRYEDLLQLSFESMGDAAIFSGGAELVPGLVKHVGESLHILGTDSQSLSVIRDPMNWLGFLQSQGFNVPDSQRSMRGVTGLDWLRKKSGRCGGRGIAPVGLSVGTNEAGDYFQKVIPGRSYSAQFVRAVNAESSLLLGCCRQLFCDENPFEYVGSVVANDVPLDTLKQIRQMGSVLSVEYDLVGIWGLDFVLDESNTAWPVDLNARMTASTELFEGLVHRSANAKSTADLQRLACVGVELRLEETQTPALVEGKLILFNRASQKILITKKRFEWITGMCERSIDFSSSSETVFADIPRLGQEVCPGQPVFTLRGRAEDRSNLLLQLRSLANAVQTKLDLGPVDLNWAKYA